MKPRRVGWAFLLAFRVGSDYIGGPLFFRISKEFPMRLDIESGASEIEQSIGLLRRRL